MDSSISPGPRAIVSMPSVTCKNGKTPFGQFRGDSNAIANNNSLCDRSSTNINGSTTTATVDITPSNVLQGIASTATPASLQGPPPRQDINDTRHRNNNNRLHIMSDINPNVSSSLLCSPPSHDRGPELPLGDNKRRRMDAYDSIRSSSAPYQTTESSSAPLSPAPAVSSSSTSDSDPITRLGLGVPDDRIEDFCFDGLQRYNSHGQGSKGQLSFAGLYRRPKNERQRKAHNEWLDGSDKLYDIALERGEVLDPLSPLWPHIQRTHDEFSTIDSKLSHIYHKDDDNKGGQMRDGDRNNEYEEDYKELGLPPPLLTSVIGIDNISESTQREVTAHCLAMAAQFMCEEQPTTLYDYAALEMTGLPACLQTHFEQIVNGDALPLNGVLVHLVRNAFESGAQESWKRRGLDMNESASSSCHEYVDSRYFERFLSGDMAVLTNVDACFESIFNEEEKKIAKEKIVTLWNIFLAWSPGRVGTCPPKFEEAKPIIAKIVVGGEDIPIVDPIKGWPKKNPERRNGGIAAFDMCKLVWSKTRSKSLVVYMTDELESPFGDDGPRWVKVWTTIGVVVLKIRYMGDGKIRVVIVFVPWCNMIFSKADVRRGWNQLQSSETAAKSAHWLKNFLLLLATPNLEELKTKKSLDRQCGDNIYLHFMSYVHLLKMWKLPKKTATLDCKNRLLNGRLNAFDASFNNLRRTAGHLDLFSVNSRAHLSIRNNSDVERVERDNKLRRAAICFATKPASTIAESVQYMLYAIRYDFLRNSGAKLNSGRAGKRYDILVDPKTAKMIDPSIQQLLRVAYKSTTENSGNTTTHRSPTRVEIGDVDVLLTRYYESGGGFFIQAAGNAGTRTKKGETTPFELPEDGTVLGTYTCNGRQKEIVFQSRDFVSIVLSGLRGRCKPPKTKGLTKRKMAKKFLDRNIGWAKDMIGLDRDTVKWAHDSYVLYVWFEPK